MFIVTKQSTWLQNVTTSNRASWPPHLTKDYGDKEVVDEECLRGMAVIVLEEERSEDDDEILDRRVTERATHHLDTADDDEERGNAGTWPQTSRLYTDTYIMVVLHNSRSVLPRLFLQGAAPCPSLVTPCPFSEAEMMPCPFLVTPRPFSEALFCPCCCPHTALIVPFFLPFTLPF